MESKSNGISNKFEIPLSPFAKYTGLLKLGNRDIDCYVLDTGERVISMRSSVKSITNTEGGNLSSYVNVKPIQPYYGAEQLSSDIIEFSIPGNPTKSKGITADTFLNICSAYVIALTDPDNKLTPKQTKIAINCASLVSACAKTGLIALIDEATGYQYERADDALQIKVQAYISEELRDWEKTFPDQLWEEFGRLTHWQNPLQSRPKYWGKLVLELVYDALDPDIAKYLRENKPKPSSGMNYHQWLTADLGVKALTTHINQIIGIAKTCDTMQELREKVAFHYKKKPMQMTLDYFVKF